MRVIPDAAATVQIGSHTQRLAALDVLRALALILVMGRHMFVTQVWFQMGWLGVHLFFVLSGFLISGLLFREYQKSGALDLKRFFIRRAFKIYPSFWLLLLVTIPLAYLTPNQPTSQQLVSEVFFLQSYIPGYWVHTWSLAVEEHFYLLLPLTLLLLLRKKHSGNPFALIPGITLAVGLFCLIARTAAVAWLPFDHHTHLYHTHIRLDALAFGTCLSYWFHFHREGWLRFMKRHTNRLWWFSAICLVPISGFEISGNPYMLTVGVTGGYLGLGALLMAAIHARSLRPERLPGAWHSVERVLGWVGQNSYGIYLWHMPVSSWAIGKFKTLFAPSMPYSMELVLYFLGSIVLGAAATRLLERPLLELRDRWYPSRNTPPPMAGAKSYL